MAKFTELTKKDLCWTPRGADNFFILEKTIRRFKKKNQGSTEWATRKESFIKSSTRKFASERKLNYFLWLSLEFLASVRVPVIITGFSFLGSLCSNVS